MESIKKIFPFSFFIKLYGRFIKKPWLSLSKKNKVVLLLALLIVAIVTKFIVNQITLAQKVEFYPEYSSTPALQRVYNLFESKQYLTLTSYIEQQLMTPVRVSDRLQLLFYRAETYFQLGQYKIAQEKFEALTKDYPFFWQANLRLASLCVILDHLKPFMTLTQNLPVSNELFYWTGRYYEALGAQNEAIENYYKSDLDDSRVNLQLGSLFYHQKKYLMAISFLQKAQELSDLNRIEILQMLFFSYAGLNDGQNMIKYSNALKPYLSNRLSLIQSISSALYDICDLEQARSMYTILDDDKQMTTDIAKVLIQLSYELKDYQSVVRYSNYIKMNDKMTLEVIEAYYALGRFSQSASTIQKYLEDNKDILSKADKIKLLDIQTNSYLNNKNYKQAIHSREEINTLDTNNIDNQLELIKIYSVLGDKIKIYHIAENVAQRQPKQVPNMVNLLLNISEPKKAQNLLIEPLNKDPENESLLFVQAKIYSAQKKWDDLKTTLHKLLQINIQDPQINYDANYALGSLYIQNKDYIDAQLYMEKAKSLNNTRQVNVKLLLIYYLENDYEQARRIMNNIQSDALFLEEMTDKEKQIIFDIQQKLS